MTTIAAFFDRFCETFKTADFEAVAGLFNTPMAAPKISPNVLLTATETAAMFRMLWLKNEALGARDYAVSLNEETWTDEQRCDAVVSWSVFGSDGDLLAVYRAAYALKRQHDGDLKITTLHWHDDSDCREIEGRETDGTPEHGARRTQGSSAA